MHLKYSLLTIVLTALLSQASGERGKWITASEALERSAKAEAVPEEGCGKWVDPQMERFSATIEKKLKPTGYKLPRSLEFTVDMGLGDSELPPLCMDAFKTELNDLGFRITETRESGNRMRPHWVGFTIEWGEEEKPPQGLELDIFPHGHVPRFRPCNGPPSVQTLEAKVDRCWY